MANNLDASEKSSQNNQTPNDLGVKSKNDIRVQGYNADNSSSLGSKEVFDVKLYDPVLAKKMALVNQAIDDIGMTGFHWKMFFLNGFGYAVDSVSAYTQLSCYLAFDTNTCIQSS